MAIQITKEMIENAVTYIPFAVKTLLADAISEWCVEETPVEVEGDTPFPPIYKEKRAARQLFMYGILARAYLQQDFETKTVTLVDKDKKVVGEENVDYFMSDEAYDEWCESHVFNQLERLKKDKEVANTVYDLLYDYKALDKMVSDAIKDNLAKKNDVCTRLCAMISMQSSEEYLHQLKEQIPELQKQLQEMSGNNA